MENISIWEKVVLALLVVVLLVWSGPGIKASLAKSKQSTNRDWKGVLIPLSVVILFVFVLIWLV